jgi:translation elongation factor EF-G
MHVRVTAKREWAGRVLAELRLRGATILEESMRPRDYVVRAEAPLSLLLGLPANLDAITGAETPCAIWLARYEPLPPLREARPPDPRHIASRTAAVATMSSTVAPRERSSPSGASRAGPCR